MVNKKYKIDYKGLKQYLETLKDKDFERNWNHGEHIIIKEGHSVDEIEYFKLSIDNFPKETIINYGEPFLVDALGNDLSILILTKRKYKLPNGRVVHAKYDRTIIEDCRKIYGTPLNGYWIIPERFIIR